MQPEQRRPRGRPGRPEAVEQIGYRMSVSLRTRFDTAKAFTGIVSNQQLVDTAVRAYLNKLEQEVDGFAVAVSAAEKARRREP